MYEKNETICKACFLSECFDCRVKAGEKCKDFYSFSHHEKEDELSRALQELGMVRVTLQKSADHKFGLGAVTPWRVNLRNDTLENMHAILSVHEELKRLVAEAEFLQKKLSVLSRARFCSKGFQYSTGRSSRLVTQNILDENTAKKEEEDSCAISYSEMYAYLMRDEDPTEELTYDSLEL